MEDVRIVRGDPGVSYIETKSRSAAQKHADSALDSAEAAATEAMEKAQEALDWLKVVENKPKNIHVPTYINKLVEEIAEVRRIRQ